MYTKSMFLNNISVPIPLLSHLPPTGQLPHCIQQWQAVTSDQWVLQVVRGYKLELTSTPTQSSQPLTGDQGQSITGGGRSTEAARQRGNKDDQPVSHPVCQQNICGPKKGWVLQTSYQSETTEPVHSSCALQDGRPSHAERSTETGGLDGLYRPKGRLPVRRNLGRAPEVSAVCLEQPTIRISVSPIWSMQCAKGLHQTAEACISKTPPPRDPADHVFGRYVGDGPVEGGVGGTSPTNYITYRVPGILSQPGEVPADPIPGNTILNKNT